ncbi:conserved hypothetical protein [Mesorhizobium plurifarium]|uniref:Uncharacterized protein n=1 Tax=Mesorhizobium plurifarium TaxID=69974 RepID=A0A0K2W2Q2_MESPL|nr:conserved hypothetical protein [Mesorhizobium plurifarium]
MGGWSIFSNVKDVVLFVLAIYGAALSTFNWRQAAKRDRRMVIAEMTTAMLTYTNGQLGPPIAQMTATNVGHRPVTITSMFVQLPAGTRLFPTRRSAFAELPDTSLPITLSDGASAKLHMTYQEIGEALIDSRQTGKVEIRFVCTDSAGGEYKSKPWQVDPQEFRTMGLN